MSGNSFPTKEGPHVTGAVAMGVDEDGFAVPAEAHTPIGTVRLDVDQLCRALAAHAAFITGKSADEAMIRIHSYVTGESA